MSKAVAVHAPETATALDAARVVPSLFPEAGVYIVQAPGGAKREFTFSHRPSLADDPLAIFREVFTKGGTYFIKAKLPADEHRTFDRWYFETLLSEAQKTFVGLRGAMLNTVTDLIRRHGGDLTDPGVVMLLERALADCRLAVRWSLAFPLPPDAERRIRALGFSDVDVLDWPGLAYRLGKMEEQLATAPYSWDKILEIARSAPALPGDAEAIAYAQLRAGQYLTPVALRDPQASVTAALEYERTMLRSMTADAVRREMNAREFARKLYNELTPQGIIRDFDRVARTELQEARLQGAWEAEHRAKGWGPDTRVYRSLSSRPCNGCLTLYKRPDGHPRTYTTAEVEAGDAQGVNTGPWEGWHVRKGPTHPNCLDSPWLTFRSELGPLFSREAGKWQEVFRRRGLVTEGAE